MYENLVQAGNMARFLAVAEQDAHLGQTRSARKFLEEFRRERNM